ncbi:MAG TPA: tetratricopeptide repeat protein [Candidatus Obscuribacterales bacterium]
MNLNQLKQSFLIALAVLTAAASHAQARTALEEGIEAYYQRRFNAAAMHFDEAIAKNPQDWRGHFYLARALEQLKDYKGARDEFMVVFQMNPFSKEGKLAKAALMDLAAGIEARKHKADDPKHFKQAVRLINAQCNDNKTRFRAQAQRAANERMQLHARSLGMAMPTRRSPWYYRESDEVSNMAYIRNSYARTDAMRQSALMRLEAAKRAEETQKSANNLKMLLVDRSVRPDSAKLRALGTNLYVRNYRPPEDDDVAPEDPPIELRARQLKLSSIFPPDKAVPAPMSLRGMTKGLASSESTQHVQPAHDFRNWSSEPSPTAAKVKDGRMFKPYVYRVHDFKNW